MTRHQYNTTMGSVYTPPSKTRRLSCLSEMECDKRCERAQIDDNKMVGGELEAAEALAAMARCSAATGSGESKLPGERFVTESVPSSSRRGFEQSFCTYQDLPKASQQFCQNTSTLVANPVNLEQDVETTTHQMCSISYRLDPASKSRQKLMKADREAQRRRRVLANRESARRTIHRRQAFYSELVCRAAELSTENGYLMKAKELALKKYNSLKTINAGLKVHLKNMEERKHVQHCLFPLQVPEKTQVETKEIQEESNSIQAENSTSPSTNPPPLLCNQPHAVPIFWPPVGPSSDIFLVPCTSHPDAAMSAHPQHPLQHLEQDSPTSINKPGAPVFVYSVPWPFQFLAHSSSTFNSQLALNEKQNEKSPSCQYCTCCSSDTLVHKKDQKLLANSKTHLEASSSCETICADDAYVARCSGPPDGGGGEQLGPTASFRHSRTTQVEDILNIKSVSSIPEHIPQALLEDKRGIIWSNGKSKENGASTEARRKRKELMNLKNLH